MKATMIFVPRTLIVRVLLAFVLAVGSARADFVIKDQTVAANSYGLVKVMGDKQVVWRPMQPLDMPLEQYQIVEGGQTGWICIFPTGAVGDVYYLDAARNGVDAPDLVRIKLTVGQAPGPGPSPPPPPPPPPDVDPASELSGLSLQIYNEALPLNDPVNAGKIADAADEVLSTTYAAVDQLHAALKAAMPPLPKAWKPVGDLITRALNEYGQSMTGARATIQAMSDGLGAIQ